MKFCAPSHTMIVFFGHRAQYGSCNDKIFEATKELNSYTWNTFT